MKNKKKQYYSEINSPRSALKNRKKSFPGRINICRFSQRIHRGLFKLN